MQDAYLAGPTPGGRLAVTLAARDLMVETEVRARKEPKTQLAVSLALLQEQKETNRLLVLLLVVVPVPNRLGFADLSQARSVAKGR